MQRVISTLTVASLLLTGPVLAKNKILPGYIVQAHTVAVIIDPSAGIDIQDPRANQVAQKDVEAALLKWGRFEPLVGAQKADLIIVIRRGHKRATDMTISDPSENNRVGATPTDNGMGAGAQNGRAPVVGGYPDRPQPQAPQPQGEIGSSDDSLAVYDGAVGRPLDGAPGWRYLGQEGLRPHAVPAVDDFRRAVEAADKAAAAAVKNR
ncbi:MAG TPA: hypothetical protein VNU92_17465 [Edaphobacter sp.]|jgi:hypothetical protein|nr:hypothetical protein [Edaphobacter sp.]